MQYHEAANYLFDLQRYAPRADLEAMEALVAALGDPHEELTVVQIAGSNGKGSTARMLERVLREAGLDVGLYTSPHLDDLRERIQVDGRDITKAAIAEFVETARPAVDEMAALGESPSFFETVTALALWEFARQSVDVAVLEVGIGGRYDATSICDPVASAVTSVTIEHADVLGDTIGEIAHDMAHTAGERPLVTATEGEALEVLRAVAPAVRTIGRPDSEPPVDVAVTYRGREGPESRVDIETAELDIETRLPLIGAHQARNAGVATALAEQVVGDGLRAPVVARGLRSASWPGRFETMSQAPLTILDGAHNPGGAERVTRTLAEFDGEYDQLHLVFGAMADKDVVGIIEALPDATAVYSCRADSSRAEASAAIAGMFEAQGATDVSDCGSVTAALEQALAGAATDDAVLVTGSLSVIGEARRRWSHAPVDRAVPDAAASEARLRGADVELGAGETDRGDALHHTISLRVQRRQARHLKQRLLALGGACAVSAIRAREELRDVVLMGRRTQLAGLADELVDGPPGLASQARAIRAHLEERPQHSTGTYPWSGDRTAVMGILNVTPDSFHDGGEYEELTAAVAQAERMIEAGASIVDVGGESTRPGATAVAPAAEIERVVPIIEALAELDVQISVDTRKAAVAEAALDAGADILNDVSGLEDPAMRLLAAERDVPVIVMHSINAPVDPDVEVAYDDVVDDTIAALTERVLLAEQAGLDREQILIDPGLGFGKSRAESFELLSRLGEFRALGCPILVGHSHKSMFELVGATAGERLPPTVAATTLAAARGADVVRVHDVAENVAAVRVAAAMQDPEGFSLDPGADAGSE
jgi:dihydropteroate synthase